MLRNSRTNMSGHNIVGDKDPSKRFINQCKDFFVDIVFDFSRVLKAINGSIIA